tara:strand:- start:483 stop:821 length:339 start_codon:yes stop_codon:yes gene_type:complete
VGLGFGDRLVFHSPGNDEELAFVEFDDPIAKMYRQVAVEDQEELVLSLVMVPDELTFELGELDVLAIELADDTGAPMFSELLEFLGEVNGVVLAAAHESARIQLRCVRRGEY